MIAGLALLTLLVLNVIQETTCLNLVVWITLAALVVWLVVMAVLSWMTTRKGNVG